MDFSYVSFSDGYNFNREDIFIICVVATAKNLGTFNIIYLD